MSTSGTGSKRLVVGAHYGLGDWLAQRITAVVMAVYTIILIASFLSARDFSYDGWAHLFSLQWMKVSSFIALLALFYHAWVGMRDIWMDYLRGTAIRLICETLTIIWLVGCAGYALQILWSV
jgi:succinate dehydrogenase / fumarate reductase membrane anchor subunit